MIGSDLSEFLAPKPDFLLYGCSAVLCQRRETSLVQNAFLGRELKAQVSCPMKPPPGPAKTLSESFAEAGATAVLSLKIFRSCSLTYLEGFEETVTNRLLGCSSESVLRACIEQYTFQVHTFFNYAADTGRKIKCAVIDRRSVDEQRHGHCSTYLLMNLVRANTGDSRES
jgi:hypothetical protein